MTTKVKSEIEAFARIRVIGAGGSGGNAVNHMVNSRVQGVDFIAVNTDAQDLHKSKAKKKIHIGKNLTRGLGTGMNPELGKQAAAETKEEIQEALKGSDMAFITCGMGGGTGTGSAPVIAQIAREMGILTIGVVTKPFSFEGAQRARLAEQGLAEMKKAVDALIMIPNDRLLAIVNRDTGIKNAFAMCDDILKQAVEGISDLITTPGIINVDFADVRTIMENAGSALMGVGIASGEKRAEEAAKLAISSPLLDVSIHGAKGVLFSVAGGTDLGMLEIQDAAAVVTEAIDPDAKVIFGAVTDESLKKGELRVTVIATGFPDGAGANQGSIMNTSFFNRTAAKPEMKKEEAAAAPAPAPKEEPAKEVRKSVIPPSAAKEEKREAPKAEPKAVPADEEEEDDWASFPSFLRRK
ncbi:MAG TPA: cell division protein FtsZ [Candidatus Paceibacterota bacterium]|nr:cell division protein FtsZ [Candidatus Paceibacterota bacterium]